MYYPYYFWLAFCTNLGIEGLRALQDPWGRPAANDYSFGNEVSVPHVDDFRAKAA